MTSRAGPASDFWSTLPFGRDVSLLVQDESGLAALDKPAGVLSHPNRRGEEVRSLLNASYILEGEYFEWSFGGAERRLWLLNRLDSGTSGVILVAASSELATQIRAHFRSKRVHKEYQALVFGTPRAPSEVWRDRLGVQKQAGRIRTTADAGEMIAESAMELVRKGGGEPRVSLIRLEPRTGRSHQLRVQCAKRNLPIIGDQTYGDFARNRAFAKLTGTKRLFLHSMATQFEYAWQGERRSFSALAPLPPEFEKFL